MSLPWPASSGPASIPLLGWQPFLARSQRADAIRLSTSQVLLAADAVLTSRADVAAKLARLMIYGTRARRDTRGLFVENSAGTPPAVPVLWPSGAPPAVTR
jgi:hypothetical protein